MMRAVQNWAMLLLQALNKRQEQELLQNYDAFQEAIIGIYSDLDRQSNAEDCLPKL